MRSRNWAALLGAVLVISVGLSLWLLRPDTAARAEIWLDGELFRTVDLREDQVIRVDSVYGSNTVTVKGGKIAVTSASCPDHYCMDRGYCSGGVQVVCLPNRLVIKFVGGQSVDGALG